MAKYGNILTIFDADLNSHSKVEAILKKNKADFKKMTDTYYIETNSKQNTGDVLKDLNGIDIEYVFFHNNISDGSQIKTNKISDTLVNDINRIMLK